MRVTTKAQRAAIKRLWERSHDGETSYLAFRRRFREVSYDVHIIGTWCGMWIGIELDGYTHS